jgi:hypothetical protein
MKKTAQTVVPLAMLLATGEAAKIETVSTSEAISASQINSQIQTNVHEANKSEAEN